MKLSNILVLNSNKINNQTFQMLQTHQFHTTFIFLDIKNISKRFFRLLKTIYLFIIPTYKYSCIDNISNYIKYRA